MNGLQNYSNLEKCHDGSNNQVYRAIRIADRTPVVIKIPRSEYPSNRELARLHNEWRILGQLQLPGIPKVYGLEKFNRTAALVLESLSGQSLHTLLSTRQLTISECLTLAIQLTQILESVHARHIVHRDIKPSNIFVDAQLEGLHLIDFGLATPVLEDAHASMGPIAIEGTLAYFAPEQTGRINRGIDERTDLYSLGATLYEALTGTLPFPASDPAVLIHSHIARIPPPPHTLRPAVPEVLSHIILKLLNKMAEDRYQSAHGLRADLEACLRSWNRDHQIAPFPLGTQDRPTRLRLSHKLYGREAELGQLHAALSRVRSGAVELALITGPAGIGKTELVIELMQSLVEQGGYMARACFDQQHQALPYGPLLRACSDLLRLALTEPAHVLQVWRQRFLAALGDSGQLLIELLPELELIIGPQPAAPQLPPLEAKNRFGLLFQNFLRQFAGAQHPLVLFFDDLQWADEASLQLVRLLLTDPFGRYLMVVGSYRAEALDGSSPLHQMLNGLRQDRVAPLVLALQPLQPAHIAALLAEALSMSPAQLDELAAVLHGRTAGNPFFVSQFITTLYRDGLLRCDPINRSWQWDLLRIQALPATDNVADILVGNLRQLTPRALQILQTAACVGFQFDLETVAQASRTSLAECSSLLSEAVHAGIVLSANNAYYPMAAAAEREGGGTPAIDSERAIVYRFLHERIQRAVYATLTEAERQAYHLRCGELLLAQWGQEAPTGRLFELVNHLNQGSPVLHARSDESALLALAKLNLAAGLRAKATAAFHAASGFFAAGTALLRDSAWSAHHALLFTLHVERGQCETLSGRFAEAEALLLALRQQAATAVEHGLIHLRLCELYCGRGDFAAALHWGLEGLALLGVSLPPQDEAAAVFVEERAEIDRLLAGRAIADLVHLPLNDSPETAVVVEIIVALSVPAYMTGTSLHPLLVTRQITLALRHGLCANTSNAFATYGFLLATVLGEPQLGYEYGQLAMGVNERLANPSNVCRIRLALGNIWHFCRPLKESHAQYEKGRQEGLALGDFTVLSLICASQAQLFPYTSEDFNESLRLVDDSLVLMQRTQDALSTLLLRHIRQELRALVGRTPHPTSLTDSEFDEAAEWQSLRQSGVAVNLMHFAWLKHTLLYLFGEHAEACALGLDSEAWLASAPGIAQQTHFVFMHCLALLAHYPAVSAAEQHEYEVRIERYHGQLRTYSGYCAANYLDRERLVAAERARVAGRQAEALMLYEEAVAAAHANGFPLHEAIALELAGRFHASCGRAKLATFYLTEALYAYLRLGAIAKVQALLNAHPDHLRAETRALQEFHRSEPGVDFTSSSANSSHRTTDDRLDVNSVLRASEAISRERALDTVIDQTLYTVLTSAGVQRGCLILERGGTLYLDAVRTISPDSIRTGLGIPIDSQRRADGTTVDLALSVVHYVVRTHEVVVLSAAVPDARFANDGYLNAAKPRSVLCLPLVSQGRLSGLLYLENLLAPVTFSPARIDLFRILSAQAATALENALLLQRIQEATEKVHRTNEVLEAQVNVRTAELQRSNGELQATNARLEVELAERIRAERERAALQEQMLKAQRERLAEMSTPLIPITEQIMIMPLIGSVDAERASQILEVALSGAQHSGAKVVILDITGLSHIDTSIAGSLIKTARALRLLGAHAVLTGIRAGVAQTLVSLGVELSNIETRSNLQSAIAFALRHTGESPLVR